jgi:hypothetical protein
MLSVREFKGSYKGLIGECLFKFKHKYAVLTQLANPDTYLEKRPYTLPKEMIAFLKSNWTRIDAFEVLLNHDMSLLAVNIFEIKTRNQYKYILPGHVELRVSPEVDKAMKSAKEYGIGAYLAKVMLFDDWRFDVEIISYDSAPVTVCEQPNYSERKASDRWCSQANDFSNDRQDS